MPPVCFPSLTSDHGLNNRGSSEGQRWKSGTEMDIQPVCLRFSLPHGSSQKQLVKAITATGCFCDVLSYSVAQNVAVAGFPVPLELHKTPVMETPELQKTSKIWLKGCGALMRWFFRCHRNTFFTFTRDWMFCRPVHFKWKWRAMLGQRRRRNIFYE